MKWGINTRVTDIQRDKDMLGLWRDTGLVHVSSGTEAAAQRKLDLFNKETKVEQNKEAIRLLREVDIFTEAQFIVGLENETGETLEETYRFARDWNPDLANWTMYTPWPFTPLFQELRDQVEMFDFGKYNFVIPIMKPAAMDRATLLDRVMHNYRRFDMIKALFHYPWRGRGFRRKYLLGCPKAFAKAGFARTFYDLGKVGYRGPQSKDKVDFRFDDSRRIAEAQMADREGMLDVPPAAMVPEREPASLHRATAETLAPHRATAAAHEGGRLTGGYILAHRIPAAAQRLLRALPAALTGPLLLSAIRRHAWTFAGSGRVTIRWRPMELVITANPLATPGCPWHRAVLETLFRRLVHPRITVGHESCCAEGAETCRFVIFSR